MITLWRGARRSWARGRALPLLLCLLASGLAQAAPTEYEVKAAFLFNFAQFAQWPTSSFPATNAPFVIGIIGADPFGPLLDEIVKGEAAAGRSLAVKRIAADKDISGCQVLFISKSEQERAPLLLRSLRRSAVLTVSDLDQFVDHGGIIQFVMEDGFVRLEINPLAAERAGIKVNSKLLRVARIVKDNEDRKGQAR